MNLLPGDFANISNVNIGVKPTSNKFPIDLVKKNSPPSMSNETWTWEDPDYTRWNHLYPYQLQVVEVDRDSLMEPGGQRAYTPKKGAGWTYTLPVPPESMTINANFAIGVHVTLDGVVEEHNGIKIKDIQISGTTGVILDRPTAPTLSSSVLLTNTLIGGSILLKTAKQAATGALHVISGGSAVNINTIQPKDFTQDTDLQRLTGYYQFKLMERFLESYAELKTTAAGRGARLAFCIHKDKQTYLVAPRSFSLNRSAARPMEYTYSLAMTATKRVSLTAGGSFDYTPSERYADKAFKLVNAVSAAMALFHSISSNTALQAVWGGGIKSMVFEPLRLLNLWGNDQLGIPLNASLMSSSTVKALQPSTLEAVHAGALPSPDAWSQSDKASWGVWKDLQDAANSNYKAGKPTSADYLFDDPSSFLPLMAAIKIGSLNIPPEVMGQINAERTDVRNLRPKDFDKINTNIKAIMSDYATSVGLGSSTYNETYPTFHPPTVTVVSNTNRNIAIRTATDEDFSVLTALNDVSIELNSFSLNQPSLKPQPIEYVAGLAQRSGIAFTVPKSKFSVPFPYRATMESLSQMYLGTATRWMEIAALNGLVAPYIDEEGFDLPLLVNGCGNVVMVSEASRLSIGQIVYLSSNASQRTKRHITKIKAVNATQYMVYLDGDSDLATYTTVAQASLHAYLPSTVNSQMMIFIPSDSDPASPGEWKTKEIPGVNEFDNLISIGGIDLMLTQTNDLVVTETGDSKWSFGITNIIQTIRLALSVNKGRMPLHQDYGISIPVGSSIADVDINELSKAVRDTFANDPTFNAIKALRINIVGPSASMDIALEIAGVNQLLPVSVQLKQ